MRSQLCDTPAGGQDAHWVWQDGGHSPCSKKSRVVGSEARKDNWEGGVLCKTPQKWEGEVMGPREGCFLRWEAENDADGMNQQRGRIRKEGRDSSRSQAGRTCPQVLLIGTSTAHLQHQEGERSKGRGMCWEDGCLVLRTSSGCPQGLFSNYVQ